jgi:hypothetical protein
MSRLQFSRLCWFSVMEGEEKGPIIEASFSLRKVSRTTLTSTTSWLFEDASFFLSILASSLGSYRYHTITSSVTGVLGYTSVIHFSSRAVVHYQMDPPYNGILDDHSWL